MLVGRKRELDTLTQCLEDARANGAVTLFVSGEPGIGKSTLLAHLRHIAAERGFATAAAVASRGGWSPAYAPWVAILDQLGGASPLPDLAADPGAPVDDYRRLVHRAVLRAIRDAAARQPVAITLDDVQWMDQPSREALVDVLRGLGNAPVLLAGSWRTPIPDRDPEFQAFAANLYREPDVRWLDLTGLGEREVTAVVAQLGWTISPHDARRLTARTNGNPFFVSELARLVGGDGEAGMDEVPTSVRQVVSLRFSGLPSPTQQMLRVAAIFPQGFDFGILRDMSDLGEDDLLASLDDALATGFLRASDDGSEHYAFAHDIVREAIALSWTPSRRARLHRRAAEAIERRFAGRTDMVSGELAAHYFASRSLEGAERGIVHAVAGAGQATQAFAFAQAAEFMGMASALASAQPLATRADIEWRWALALAESLQIDAATEAAGRAIDLLRDSGAPPETVAHACWRLAHTLNAVGAGSAIRNRLRDEGLAVLGARRDIHWARLRLLEDPIVVVPNDVLFVTRWVGFDPEARRIALQSRNVEDQVQTIESFDLRTPGETRTLIAHARTWQHPRAALRALTGAANDLTYRHGEFRQAMGVWNEILDRARRIGAVPWQANALNQVTLLHVTLGEFAQAVTSKRLADEVNAELGPTSDVEVLQMERDFALTHYLDGDWPGQATYWLQFAGEAPLGLEAQLNTPLYAAIAASAAATAGANVARALRLIDALAGIATIPGIQQVNGVVAWAADAIARLGATDRAATYDRLAAGLIGQGVGDYPQTSLHLTRARMLALMGDPQAQRMFDVAHRTLDAQGQGPLLGIACYEQAVASTTPVATRRQRLAAAIGIFARLGMTSWHERALAASARPAPERADLDGVSQRELEVLRLVALGYSDRRVADDLFISERTVNAHVRSMLSKTGVRNRTGLSNWARSKGILEESTP
jgi:DNA-binding CsgD family transcriptional regulator